MVSMDNGCVASTYGTKEKRTRAAHMEKKSIHTQAWESKACIIARQLLIHNKGESCERTQLLPLTAETCVLLLNTHKQHNTHTQQHNTHTTTQYTHNNTIQGVKRHGTICWQVFQATNTKLHVKTKTYNKHVQNQPKKQHTHTPPSSPPPPPV